MLSLHLKAREQLLIYAQPSDEPRALSVIGDEAHVPLSLELNEQGSRIDITLMNGASFIIRFPADKLPRLYRLTNLKYCIVDVAFDAPRSIKIERANAKESHARQRETQQRAAG